MPKTFGSTAINEEISYSQLMEFASCRYKWDLKYNKKIVARTQDKAPTLGSAVHVGMAAGMLGQDYVAAIRKWGGDYIQKWSIPMDSTNEFERDLIQLNEELETQIDEIEDEAIHIVTRTLKYFDPKDWEVFVKANKPSVELHLKCPIKKWKGFHGFIDLIAVEKATGHRWLIDYKVRKALQNDNNEETNLQMAAYQHLALKNGIETVGSITLQILAKVTSMPKLNKDGSMSRTKIACDWETYKQALILAGLNVEDYYDMRDKLDTEFVRESRAYRSSLEVRKTWEDIITPMAMEMGSLNKRIFRTMGTFNCRNCWAKEYCLEDLRGRDPSHLVGITYEPYRGTEEKDVSVEE